MTEFEHVQVVTTTDSAESATMLARTAVERRLAACAQVFGPLCSVYWWEGKVDTAQEWRVVLKTTAAAYADLEAHIKAGHGYEVPEVVMLPITAGNPDYLEWITAETSGRS
ncbi:divalent-cation tolerance protein CutA [Glycomyces albidus]|jgi:periplasmic divalent cation tolerance protein|uniref:Divalent cation tolerance protein CutA n=1 Tax=Glycomyces albidus TaxID=2656774 RepID=A0A6L5G8B8_9ACTN|nr:divalent-cation tolerance protein CutA [Glycomyces albidus]MQM25929.1 divalent cation tolerance protein CutA [Glycomyces albidus]